VDADLCAKQVKKGMVFINLLPIMMTEVGVILHVTHDLTPYTAHTSCFVHACRAALVLACAADRLGDLLRSQGKGKEDTQLGDHVLVAALVEARSAVRFMMESLLPGVLLVDVGT
jgi:hypothetical protein